MAILNPRFEFLKADLENGNLKTKNSNSVEPNTGNNEQKQMKDEEPGDPKNLQILYVKSIPIFIYVNAVPADIYSASLFLLVKSF